MSASILSFIVLPLVVEHAEQTDFVDYVLHSNVLNVALVALLLYWVFRKFQLGSLLDKRQAAIMQSIESAEQQLAISMQEHRALETKTAGLQSEVDAILTEARQTGERVRQSLVNDAERDAQRILAQAQKRVAQEQATAQRDIETRLMQDAIHASRTLLESTLSGEDKLRSVETFIDNLPTVARQKAK